MSPSFPLNDLDHRGPITVPDPRRSHPAATALARAFRAEQRMPAEWELLLRRLG